MCKGLKENIPKITFTIPQLHQSSPNFTELVCLLVSLLNRLVLLLKFKKKNIYIYLIDFLKLLVEDLKIYEYICFTLIRPYHLTLHLILLIHIHLQQDLILDYGYVTHTSSPIVIAYDRKYYFITYRFSVVHYSITNTFFSGSVYSLILSNRCSHITEFVLKLYFVLKITI